MPQRTTFTADGRLVVAEAVMPLLTHLAVGTFAWGHADPDPTAMALGHEIARVRYIERLFVVEDPDGTLAVAGAKYSPSDDPTRLVYLRFRFIDAEAQGQWSEMGVFAGPVTYQPGTSRPEYAANGVYDATLNPTGQVLNPGRLFRLTHLDPTETKPATTLDVQLIVEVIRAN